MFHFVTGPKADAFQSGQYGALVQPTRPNPPIRVSETWPAVSPACQVWRLNAAPSLSCKLF